MLSQLASVLMVLSNFVSSADFISTLTFCAKVINKKYLIRSVS